MNLIKTIQYSLLFSFCVLSPLNCAFAQKTMWTVGTSPDNPPYEFYQNGSLVGFDVELMKSLAEAADVQLKWVEMEFATLIPALRTGKIDMAIAGFDPTPERSSSVDFSVPYIEGYSVLVTFQDSPITTIQDFKDKHIGVQLGTSHESKLQRQTIPGIKLRLYNKVTEMIQDLKVSSTAHKRIDGIVVGTYEAKKLVESYPKLKAVSLQLADPMSIAFKKGSTFKAIVDTYLQQLQSEHAVQTLKVKWNLEPSDA